MNIIPTCPYCCRFLRHVRFTVLTTQVEFWTCRQKECQGRELQELILDQVSFERVESLP